MQERNKKIGTNNFITTRNAVPKRKQKFNKEKEKCDTKERGEKRGRKEVKNEVHAIFIHSSNYNKKSKWMPK